MSRARTGADDAHNPKQRVVTRLREADLPTDRFIDVHNDGKASTDHTLLEASVVTGNYGVYAGRGLVIIDDDTKPETDIPGIDDLKATFSVGSPNGTPEGIDHRYYRVKDAAQTLESEFDVTNPVAEWGEVRVENQYVVGPGSDNPEGSVRTTYEITNDAPIAELSAESLVGALKASGYGTSDTEATDAPERGTEETAGEVDLSDEELLEKASNAQNGRKFSRLWEGNTSGYPSHSEADLALCNLLAYWTHGDKRRMDDLFRQSGLYRDKWDRDDYRTRTLDKAVQGQTDYYDPGGPNKRAEPRNRTGESGVSKTLDQSAVKVAAGLGEDDHLSDLPVAKRAYFTWRVINHSDEYHIAARVPDNTLFAYDGDRGIWKDNGEEVVRQAGKAILKDEYSKMLGNELIEQVQTAPNARIDQSEFGAAEGKLVVKNGLLDLDTREVREPRPDDYALLRLPVAFDPNAECERWREFIREVVEPGEEWRKTIQEYVGYCLCVHRLPYHRALLLVGEGANGKSTFLNVIRALLGRDNLCATSLQKLAKDEHARSRLFGSIANIDADLSSEALGNGGMFKKLLGDDRVQARKLYQDGFEFNPKQKHLYAANEVPDTSIDDDAFFRRWLILEFPNYFPPSERDPDLYDTLTEPDQLSGILNWALEGRDRLLENGGFTHDPLSGEVRARWKSWGDAVSEFTNEFIEADGEGQFTTAEAYDRFKAWHQNTKDGQPDSQQTLTSAIKKTEGATYKKSLRVGGSQTRGFVGVSFTDDAPEPANNGDTGRQQERLP